MRLPHLPKPRLPKPRLPQNSLAAKKISGFVQAILRERMQEKSAFPWRSGCRLSVLHDGDAFYGRLLQCFALARRNIFIELYWFESGVVAERVFEALAAAVKRGVAVYCILDDIGSYGLTKKDRERLRIAGVFLRFYNPVQTRAIFQNLRRDHRKVFIVDTHFAFVGGPGVADPFIGQAGAPCWRDVLFELQGPIVVDFYDYFTQFWRSFSDQSIPIEPGLDSVTCSDLDSAVLAHHQNCKAARLVLGFGERRQQIKINGLKAIRRAKNEVWYFTGYFYPSWKLRRALRQAAGRGVVVKLLLPGPYSDHPFFAEAGRYYYRYLLRHGVQIFEYQPRFQHMKLLLCDDWVSFGSSNLDRWNQRWNLEANVEVLDADFVCALRQEFVSDFSHAKAIEPALWLDRPWWRRVKTYLIYRISLGVELWLSRRRWRRKG